MLNRKLAEPVVTEEGEILAQGGEELTEEVIDSILASESSPSIIKIFNNEGNLVPVINNNHQETLHVTREDIIASIGYLLNLMDSIGYTDDIDHLGNRRLRCVGELLQNQFRIGLSRMERVVRERMTIQDVDAITPQALINIRPVIASMKEFFGSSQLSQFMDQTNPLAELLINGG